MLALYITTAIETVVIAMYLAYKVGCKVQQEVEAKRQERTAAAEIEQREIKRANDKQRFALMLREIDSPIG